MRPKNCIHGNFQKNADVNRQHVSELRQQNTKQINDNAYAIDIRHRLNAGKPRDHQQPNVNRSHDNDGKHKTVVNQKVHRLIKYFSVVHSALPLRPSLVAPKAFSCALSKNLCICA